MTVSSPTGTGGSPELSAAHAAAQCLVVLSSHSINWTLHSILFYTRTTSGLTHGYPSLCLYGEISFFI